MYRVRSEYAATKVDGSAGKIDILIEVARISYPWTYEPIIIDVIKDGPAQEALEGAHQYEWVINGKKRRPTYVGIAFY